MKNLCYAKSVGKSHCIKCGKLLTKEFVVTFSPYEDVPDIIGLEKEIYERTPHICEKCYKHSK